MINNVLLLQIWLFFKLPTSANPRTAEVIERIGLEFKYHVEVIRCIKDQMDRKIVSIVETLCLLKN